MKTSKYLPFFLIAYSITVLNAQCIEEVDFHLWQKEGNPGAIWLIENDSTVVIDSDQGATTPPTFFVSPDEYMNVKIKGRMTINQSTDDDFIGFVFGYKKPNNGSSPYDYDFILFDWKKKDGSAFGQQAREGFSLVKVESYIDTTTFWRYFWGHVNEPGVFQVLKSKWGNNYGWEYNVPYDFELTYTSTRILININGEKVFDVPGCFETGRFGFYCFSQEEGARFQSFDYQLEVDFKIRDDGRCAGNPVRFIAIDEQCSVIPSNIESWMWDFGDGTTSLEINPTHSYLSDGTFDVQLKVRDIYRCTDSTSRSLSIYPYPDLSHLQDTTIGYNSDITIDAGISGASYLWTTGHYERELTLEQLRQDTVVGVQVSKNGCSSFKEITVFVEPPPSATLFIPNAFSPNADGLNDSFMAQGKNIAQFNMRIYDRWGNLMFHTNQIAEGWDGKHKGQQCHAGVYVYTIHYQGSEVTTDDVQYIKKGTLALIR